MSSYSEDEMDGKTKLDKILDKLLGLSLDNKRQIQVHDEKLEEVLETISDLRTLMSAIEAKLSNSGNKRSRDKDEDEDEEDEDENILSDRLKDQIESEARTWKNKTLEAIQGDLENEQRFISLAKVHCPKLNDMK
jgi:hypothetical protein